MKMAYKLLDGTKMLRSLRVSGCRIIKWLPAAFSIRAAAGKRTGFVIVQSLRNPLRGAIMLIVKSALQDKKKKKIGIRLILLINK